MSQSGSNLNPTVLVDTSADSGNVISDLRAYVRGYPIDDVFVSTTSSSGDEEEENEDQEPLLAEEVFDLIRNINDPEHPLSLEQLKVVSLEHIAIHDDRVVSVQFTPTIPHCSMATLIGLSIQVKLLRSLPRRCKVDVRIYPNTHASEAAINKQLNDKERVTAALENHKLLDVVNRCLM